MKWNKVSALLMAAVLVLTLPARAEDAFVIREDAFIQEDSAHAEIVSEEPVLSETELEEGVPEEPLPSEAEPEKGVPEEPLPAEAEPEEGVPEEPLPAEAVQDEVISDVPDPAQAEELLSAGPADAQSSLLLSPGVVPAPGGLGDPNYFLSAGRLPEYHRWTDVSSPADYSVPDGIWQDEAGGFRCWRDGKYFIDGYCTVNGKIYYADENGYLLTGWQKTLFSNAYGMDSLNDEQFRLRYYDPETCELVTGFREIDGILHYFKEDDQGKLGTNIYLERDGQMYYADRYGICGPVRLRYGNTLITEGNQNNDEYLAKYQVPAVDPETFQGQSGEYTFRPKWYEGRTSYSIFGCPVKRVSDGVYFALTDGSSKGNIGCIFRSVGKYNGREIDLKITILDYTFFSFNGSDEVGYFYVLDDRIGITATNLEDITASMQFLDHDTGELVQVKGYATFSDIDIGQSVDILSDVDEVFVDQNCVLYKDPGSLSFSAPWVTSRNGSAVTDEDRENWVQVNYTSDTLVFRFGSAYSHYCFDDTGLPINGESHYVWNQGFSGNEYDYGILVNEKLRQSWLGLYFNRLGMVSIPPVSKLVTDCDEIETTENTLEDFDEAYMYTLCHNVPGECPEFFYDSYMVRDQIPDDLIPDISGFRVLDDGDHDVTDRFICSEENNLVTFRAKEEWLRDDAFYDNNYNYLVPVSIKEGASVPRDADGYCRFYNTCTAVFTRPQGEEETTSNETVTRVKNKMVECEIIITKMIRESDTLRAHGNPTFFFAVDGTDEEGNPHHYEEFICFDQSGCETDGTGNAFKSCRISHIPAGYYEVTELPCLDYYLTGASADTANMDIAGGEYTGTGSDHSEAVYGRCTLDAAASFAGITFRDAKRDYHGYRHNDVIKNTISLAAGTEEILGS